MLRRTAGGFGAAALSALWAEHGFASPTDAGLHHSATAKHVIFLYMDGGVSQIDSFDPKPRLNKEHGQPFAAKIEPTQFDNIGTTFGCPWKFAQHGECGAWVSELFPHVAACVDDLAIMRGMVSEFSEHNTANFFLHTGAGQQGRPSMGAWVSYGLGTESENLPGFIVINGGLVPSGGPDNFGPGYLPASYQATVFKPQELPIANLRSPVTAPPEQAAEEVALLRDLDDAAAERFGRIDAVESAIANYELAYRMQTAVPMLADVESEPEHIRKLYGLDAEFSGKRPARNARERKDQSWRGLREAKEPARFRVLRGPAGRWASPSLSNEDWPGGSRQTLNCEAHSRWVPEHPGRAGIEPRLTLTR